MKLQTLCELSDVDNTARSRYCREEACVQLPYTGVCKHQIVEVESMCMFERYEKWSCADA